MMIRAIKQLTLLATGLGFIFCSLTVQAELPPQINGKQIPSMSNMLTKAMPAVVNITVLGEMPLSAYLFQRFQSQQQDRRSGPYGRQGLPPQMPPSGDNSNGDRNVNDLPPSPKFQDMGSGVIVDAQQGYIVTNAHVVRDAKLITVMLSDGRRLKATLVGVDRLSDIAILKVTAKNLQAIPFSNQNALKVGDFVAAIGNPFGLNQTVTSGVVSALHRSDLGIDGYENFIQTDASINPGNSGGALVNLQGELVGINTALIGPVSGSVGIGFAIPGDMVKSVMMQLIQKGKVERGVLGVMVQNLTPALAEAFAIPDTQGALVTNIIPGSPAAKAGLQAQDVVEKINGEPIMNAAQLKNTIGILPFGSDVALQVRRQNKVTTEHISIINPKELKLQRLSKLAAFLDGIRLTAYDELVPELGHIKGVGVLDVDETSEGWLSGLRPGDIILEANNQPTATVDQLTQAISKNSQRLLLKIGRFNGIMYLVLD